MCVLAHLGKNMTIWNIQGMELASGTVDHAAAVVKVICIDVLILSSHKTGSLLEFIVTVINQS